MVRLRYRDVAHAYRRFPGRPRVSLEGVSLDVHAGQCWGLVGPNGSGKSTLLRLAAGLAVPRAGSVALDGHAAGTRPARALVGYAPENVEWPRSLSVGTVLHELAALSGLAGAGARVERVLRPAGLVELVDRRFGTLSLGQARRVVVAQALLDDPALLLLDEPFSALDSIVIQELRDDLARRCAGGAAVVLASHRLEDLVGLCTHVAVLRRGRLVAQDEAGRLLPEPGDRAGLAALFGSVN